MSLLTVYGLFITLGFLFAYLFRTKARGFSWQEYSILFFGPFLGLLYVVYTLGNLPLFIFAIGSIGLTLTEWIVGFIYHKVMGSHLWIYERYSLPGRYTSFLSVPIWGFGAVLLWLIFRTI